MSNKDFLCKKISTKRTNLSGAKAKIFHEDWVNTMSADALATFVTMTSAASSQSIDDT